MFKCNLSYCLRVRLHASRGWLQSTPEPRGADGHLLHLLPLTCSNDKNKLPASLWKKLAHISGGCCSRHLKDGLPDCLALISSRACIHESHRTVANRESVLKRHVWALTVVIPSGLNTEGTGKNAHLPVFPGRGLTAHSISCCLRIWLLISMHIRGDYNPTTGSH